MPKQKNIYICQVCGYEASKWLGRCPSCGEWNSFSEELKVEEDSRNIVIVREKSVPIRIGDIQKSELERIKTGISQFDLILNGGFVKGQVLLLSGEPGIGKSTITLQIANKLSHSGKVLYINSEESNVQVKIRAERLGVNSQDIFLLPENNLESIIEFIATKDYNYIIVDSVQNIFSSKFSSPPGSITQVKECTNTLTEVAKHLGITSIIIGHVNKEGIIAGPKAIEHIVDTVVMIDKDQKGTNRIIRVIKNRFGPTNEIGIFSLTSHGIEEVNEMVILSEKEELVGSVLCPVVEGTRSILVEIQTLVNETQFGYAKRTSDGININRLYMISAVMDRYLRTKLSTYDIYLNVTSGFEITENASDLAVAYSLLSSLKEKEIPRDIAVFGEIGLSGEIRAVPYADLRLQSLSKSNVKKVILPKGCEIDRSKSSQFEIIEVSEIYDVLDFF